MVICPRAETLRGGASSRDLEGIGRAVRISASSERFSRRSGVTARPRPTTTQQQRPPDSVSLSATAFLPSITANSNGEENNLKKRQGKRNRPVSNNTTF
jgi:hypothetical protein